MRDIRLDLFDVAAEAPFVRYGQAPGGRRPQGFIVRGIRQTALDRNVVEGAHQPAPAHFLRIQELERSGCGIARIGKGGVLIGLALAIQGFERGIGHQDFAADLEFLGIVTVQDLGDVGDVPDVLRDIVAHHAVSARKGAQKLAVAVGEADGRPVEFQLAAVGESIAFQALRRTGREFLNLGDTVGIAQRQHGIAVRHLDEFPADAFFQLSLRGLQVASHPTGGGVGRREFGIGCLQSLQLMHKLVVVVVRHGGGVFDIVLSAVLPEDGLQFIDPYLGFRLIHVARLRARMCAHKTQRYNKSADSAILFVFNLLCTFVCFLGNEY